MASTTTLTATSTEVGTAGVYATIGGGVIGSTGAITTTGVVTVAAQSALTAATLKVLDTAGNAASVTASVQLGTLGADAITLVNNQIAFGFADSDTFFIDNTGTVTTWNVKGLIADLGTSALNTTPLANAAITGLNGDVLKFSNADLAALTGFVNSTNAAYVTPLTTSGSTIETGALVAGSGAQTATGTTAQFLYNSTDGTLKFDADGGGIAASAVDVAILPVGLSLTVTDFLIVA